MASISREPSGRRTVQFVAGDGKRRSIRLGRVSEGWAETARTWIQVLLDAKTAGRPVEPDALRWLAKIDGRLADRLAAAGLISPRERPTLQAFLEKYAQGRGDVKPATQANYKATRKHLVEYFGPDKPLREITPGDADGFRQWIVGKGFAENTVRKLCGNAKQFFRAAVRSRLVDENVFSDLKSTLQADRTKFRYVTGNEAGRILEACPDAQWRLIFALSRYGGLRTPSEQLALKWGDVDWDRGRFNVHSPKTERHLGGASRIVPLFPELRPHLEAAFDRAEPGTQYVVTRYRDSPGNWGRYLGEIVAKAGVAPWIKTFMNLRASRETELAKRFPIAAVCAWLGNSEAVAAKHYLHVTEDDFLQAVQNPVQQALASSRTEPAKPGFARECGSVPPSANTLGVPVQLFRDVPGTVVRRSEHDSPGGVLHAAQPGATGTSEGRGRVGRSPTAFSRLWGRWDWRPTLPLRDGGIGVPSYH